MITLWTTLLGESIILFSLTVGIFSLAYHTGYWHERTSRSGWLEFFTSILVSWHSQLKTTLQGWILINKDYKLTILPLRTAEGRKPRKRQKVRGPFCIVLLVTYRQKRQYGSYRMDLKGRGSWCFPKMAAQAHIAQLALLSLRLWHCFSSRGEMNASPLKPR